MYLFGKGRGLLLLADIEGALIHAVADHRVAELAAGELVQHQALFAGVDDLAVIEGGKLLRELRFLRKLAESRKHFVVHALGGKIVAEAARHGDAVFRHTLGALLAGHRLGQVHTIFER